MFRSRATTEYASLEALIPNKNDRFKKRAQFNDSWAAVLFFTCFLAFSCISYSSISAIPFRGSHFQQTKLPLRQMSGFLFTTVGTGFGLSLLYFLAMQKYAGQLIVGTMLIAIVLNILIGVGMIIVGQIFFGGIACIFSVVVAWLYYSWRGRIPFAKVMLSSIVGITRKYPATIVSGIVGLIFGAGLTAWWIFTTVGLIFWAQKNSFSDQTLQILLVYSIFFFYWTSQIISNSVHLTVCGVIVEINSRSSQLIISWGFLLGKQ